MTRSEQKKFEKAIHLLKEEYILALKNNSITKPMSYALYSIWREYDKSEKPHVRGNEE